MPHVVRSGKVDLGAVWAGLPRGPWRWGAVVARLEGCYLADHGRSLLVAGVVVEYGRPQHPVILVSLREEETAVHLWPSAPVERTDGVKRLLAQVARELPAFGAGAVTATNIGDLLE